MYGVIYVDVLVLVNTITGWFLLRCAAQFARRPQRWQRMLAASAAAGFSSLVILLPPLPRPLQATLSLSLAASIVRIAFPFDALRVYIKTFGAYFTANMLCAAAALAAAQTGVRGVAVNNGAVYLRVSPVLLILCVLGVYTAVEAWDYLFGAGSAQTLRSFTAEVMGAPVAGTVLLDSGFRASDPAFGTPLVLFSYPGVSAQLPEPLRAALDAYFERGTLLDTPRGLSLTGVRTAGGLSVLPTAALQSFSLPGAQSPPRLRAAFSRERFADGQFCAIVAASLYQT